MTEQQRIEQLIYSASWLGRTPGLERMTALLERLGNPHHSLKFVHIAGTNGKGSTAAMTASILTRAGYKTALFTSPHLVRLSERFQIDGVEISHEMLEAIAQEVTCAAAEIQPTGFELMAAIGLLYFARQQCQMVVLEVGMGGRLDASNVIAPPEVAVITAIGLDHTPFLGDSLPQIAGEKAGILKAGTTCVLYHQPSEVMEVVAQRAAELEIPLIVTQPQALIALGCNLEGQTFSYCDERYTIPLLGHHQLENAAVVLEVVDVLRRRGWNIPREAVGQGLATARWSGRMEVLSQRPDFLVDGGHNSQCLTALMGGLKELYPHQKGIFLMGILGDKNMDEMLDLVLPMAKQMVTITPNSPRALSAQQLAERIEERGVPAVAADTVAQGVEMAFGFAEPQDVICAFGSLYTVGGIKKCHKRHKDLSK